MYHASQQPAILCLHRTVRVSLFAAPGHGIYLIVAIIVIFFTFVKSRIKKTLDRLFFERKIEFSIISFKNLPLISFFVG